MKQQELEVFIDIVANYFNKRSISEVTIETPYLSDDVTSILYEYTSGIAISGNYQGNIYFSAPIDFIEKIILAHNQNNFSEEMLRDAIGEVANVLSGNARKSFGHDFVISVPYFCDDIHEDVKMRGAHSFVIPMVWMEHNANLIVSVDSSR